MTRRSLLFSPGDRPELMAKAPSSGADVLCFDLEDAVAPGRKTEARAAVRETLIDPEFDPDAEVTVRLTTTDAGDDLDALVGAGDAVDDTESNDADEAAETDDLRLDGVVLPKVETAKRVETTAAMCDERDLDVAVLALVETAAGVQAAPGIADADPTDALLFGAEDFAADVGAVRTEEGTEVLYARERIVTAAAAAGIDAIDTVFTDFGDETGLREDTEFAVSLGYDGKLAIHPAQVPVINDAYTPEPDRVEWAEAVLDAREAADAEGRGVFQVDGEMIDAPLIAQAERVIARAEAAGIR